MIVSELFMKTEMDQGGPQVFEFDDFRVESATRLVLHRGERVPLTPKVFDTLLYLLRHRDRVVRKDELMAALWPDSAVEENNLNQNISTLRRMLQNLAAAGARYIATVSGAGYRFTAEIHGVTAGESLLHRLAVLPFLPVVEHDRDEALELGMADTLIARLSSVSPQLVVRPLSSVRRYSAVEQDPLVAARVLSVDSVLEGSLQRQGSRIRVSARLLDAQHGSALWAATFDEDFTDVFALQDRIAQKVTAALAVQLYPHATSQRNGRVPQNVEAYQLYLRGRYLLERTVRPSILKSIEFFKQAIDTDPLYALAYAGLADAYRRLPITSDVPARDASPLARAAALRALEIHEELAEAHTWLGFIKMWFEWDWGRAEQEMERGIALDPHSGNARMAYQHLLVLTGRDTEALEQGALATELDPLSLIVNANHGWTLFIAGRMEEAFAQTEKTLQLDPNFWVAQLNLGKLHLAVGEYQPALAAFTRARDVSGGNTEPTSLIGYTAALAGDGATARRTLEELQSRAPKLYTPPFNIAVLCNALGDRHKALDWLERAIEERDVHLVFLKRDPKWDSYRSDARFKRILAQLSKT